MIDAGDFLKWLNIFNIKAGPAGNGNVVGPSSATDNAIVRYDGTTGKLIQNSGVTISDAGAMAFPSGQSISLPGASFVAANSFNGTTVQFTGANGANNIILQPSEARALLISDGVAPSGYLDIDTTAQNINIRTLLNLFDDLKFNTLQYTTGTIAQSGTVITGSGTTFTSAMNGGWLVPATGSSQLFYFNTATSAYGMISQTIAAGTTFILFYFDASVSALTTDQLSNINMFTASRNVTFGNSLSRFIGGGAIAARNGFISDTSFPSLAATPVGAPTQTASQSLTTVTGVGTTFTLAMVGQMIIYATGQSAFITGFNSTTSLTVAQSATVPACAFYITGTGFAGNQVSVMDGLGNFGTYNAYIKNTLNLPNGTFAVGGNTAFSGAFTFTGTLTGNTGITFPTSGTLGTSTLYLELNQNSTQSITGSTQTEVQFPNSVKNTFGSNLTISGTGNTTFTNASGKDMYLTIHSSLAVDNSSAGATALWLGIVPTRVIGNNSVPVISLNDGGFTKNLPNSVCGVLFLANGDSFKIMCSTNGSTVLGNSASINSQVYRTCLMVSGVVQ